MNVELKLQAPLASTFSRAPWLCYERGHKNQCMIDSGEIPEFVKEYMRKNSVSKVYVLGSVHTSNVPGGVGIAVVKILEDQYPVW